ncbi:MAG: hypothetical protein H7834_16700, partial [Magnetococcus sp. YQC-9]
MISLHDDRYCVKQRQLSAPHQMIPHNDLRLAEAFVTAITHPGCALQKNNKLNVSNGLLKMRQQGVQSMNFKGSSLLAMAGALALVVGTAACGGGSSSSGTASVISGGLVDGLLIGSKVDCKNSSGTILASTTSD